MRLSYINFEEGRILVLTPVIQNNGFDGLAIDGNMDLPDGKRGALDYFVRDYQQNVRMILTQETHYGINEATMEVDRAANEELFFGQQGSSNEVATTRFAKPGGWNANTSSSVSKLSKLTGHTIGPNSLLKVMAGDMLSAKADYYYAGPVTNNNNSQIADIVTGLIQSITGSPAVNPIVHGNTANISSELTGSLPFASLADPDKNTGDQIPRAYLNIIFFNERFEFVEEGSMVKRVIQPGDDAAPLIFSNIKAPKNGYAYIYLSNENDDAVYWDNFTVSYTRGKIIEENHYYAFGLRIAGISSRKFDGGNEGDLVNHYLYNDKELFEDADLNWYDYGFRNYDPQIARFTQLDPLTWDYPFYTPYQYAGNEPIANVDLDGLEELSSITKPTLLDRIVIDMPVKTPMLTKNLIPSALNLTIRNIPRTDHAYSQLNSIGPDTKLKSKLEVENDRWHLFDKLSNWLKRISSGRGSYQDYGIVFSGNDKGKGEIQFRDHAGEIIDNIDLGSSFFSAVEGAGLDPKALEELLNTPAGLKYVVHALETATTVKDATQNILEGVEKMKKPQGIDPMFTKEGNIIYDRGKGYNLRVINKKGEMQIEQHSKANDTFPHNKVPPFYIYPIEN